MRVPLSVYQRGEGRVYSLVARVPFTPVDLDIAWLARGEWDALSDRFRFWFIPRIEGRNDKPVCHFTVRKFDREGDVLLFMNIVPKLEALLSEDSSQEHFVVGILSNDDVRARAALSSFLDVPPSFHRRQEVRLIERRWRDDPGAVMLFLANVHSVTSASVHGSVSSLRVAGQPAMDALAALKEGMVGWWEGAG